jgi:hypothetical protein
VSNLTKSTVFETSASRAETPMDKTTRAAREILDAETEHREAKTARLRKARRDSNPSPADKVIVPTTSGARRKPRTKASA